MLDKTIQTHTLDIQKPPKKSFSKKAFGYAQYQKLKQEHRDCPETTTIAFSRGKRMHRFFTEDSKRYITPCEEEKALMGYVAIRSEHTFESSLHRFTSASSEPERSFWRGFLSDREEFLGQVLEKGDKGVDENGYREPIAQSYFQHIFSQLSPKIVVRFSLVGAVVLGMVSMGLITTYLGQGVLAREEKTPLQLEISRDRIAQGDASVQDTLVEAYQENGTVLGAQAQDEEDILLEDASMAEKKSLDEDQEVATTDFHQRASDMVSGYPIENMLPYILERDEDVAAFVLAIAKKESNWGKRVPVYNGEDCFNYWGYRAPSEVMGSGGHTCFDNREEAVRIVADRIEELMREYNRDTAKELIVWKCGYSCEGHSDYSVQKWIDDVALYYHKFTEE